MDPKMSVSTLGTLVSAYSCGLRSRLFSRTVARKKAHGAHESTMKSARSLARLSQLCRFYSEFPPSPSSSVVGANTAVCRSVGEEEIEITISSSPSIAVCFCPLWRRRRRRGGWLEDQKDFPLVRSFQPQFVTNGLRWKTGSLTGENSFKFRAQFSPLFSLPRDCLFSKSGKVPGEHGVSALGHGLPALSLLGGLLRHDLRVSPATRKAQKGRRSHDGGRWGRREDAKRASEIARCRHNPLHFGQPCPRTRHVTRP